MPVDYSKFDKIDDSDEETPAPSQRVSATGGYPQARPAAKAAAPGGGKRALLEPTGTAEDRFKILGAPATLGDAAKELERWSAPPPAGGKEPPQSAQKPGEPQRLCVNADGRKKVHTTFPDGSEVVEEFDEKTGVLLLRRSRRPTTLGREAEWELEVGQVQERPFDPTSDMVRPSQSNPVLVRKDTPEAFQWRIRNLPYPPEVYSVGVDHEKQQVVVRTSNKKYYKRIDIPDLSRLKLRLEDGALSWKHQYNTLVISYQRPPEVLADEVAKLRLADQTAVPL